MRNKSMAAKFARSMFDAEARRMLRNITIRTGRFPIVPRILKSTLIVAADIAEAKSVLAVIE